MPSDRKDSPSSLQSVESAGSSKADHSSSSGEAGRGTPDKQQGTGNSKVSPRNGSASNKRTTLPSVRRAFKGTESADSSTSNIGRQTRSDVAMSRMSVQSVTSGGRTDVNSVMTLNTARPDVEVAFVDPLEKHHECPVCGQVLRYPVQFECKHRCCSGCLSEVLRVEPRCPIDQAKIERDKVLVDKQLQRTIENLAVFCSNQEKGCLWSERYKDLMQHLRECEFGLVTCPNNCDAEYQRRFAEQHENVDCPFRPISCLHCRVPLVADDEADHLMECPRLPVLCPNGCKHKEMPREEVQQHMETKCSKHQVTCSFSSLGCQHKCVRKELSDHNKAQAELHMTLVAEALAEYKRSYDQHAVVLQRHTEKLAGVEFRVEGLENLYGAQLVWKIDKYQERFEEAQTGKKSTIYSPPFYAHRHGHKLIASVCLNGDGKSRGKHMSVFICIVRGEYDNILHWPFSHRLTLTLIDQSPDPAARRNVTYSVKPNVCKENKAFLSQPTTDRNASFGSQRFVEMELLKSREYIRDDVMFLKVVVENEDTDVI